MNYDHTVIPRLTIFWHYGNGKHISGLIADIALLRVMTSYPFSVAHSIYGSIDP